MHILDLHGIGPTSYRLFELPIMTICSAKTMILGDLGHRLSYTYMSLTILCLHCLLQLPLTTAIPLQGVPAQFASTDSRCATVDDCYNFLQVLFCKGGLPSAPYPGKPIFMASHSDPISHLVTSLEYFDDEIGEEYIITREGLCTRAGCKCTQWGLVCNNFEYAYFNPTIHFYYRPLCMSSCVCMEVIPTSTPTITIEATLSAPTYTNHGVANVSNVATGASSSDGTMATSGDCVAGGVSSRAIGRQPNCCPGYQFQALTQEQAHGIYRSALSIRGMNQTAHAIGVCLSPTSTSDVSTS